MADDSAYIEIAFHGGILYNESLDRGIACATEKPPVAQFPCNIEVPDGVSLAVEGAAEVVVIVIDILIDASDGSPRLVVQVEVGFQGDDVILVGSAGIHHVAEGFQVIHGEDVDAEVLVPLL